MLDTGYKIQRYRDTGYTNAGIPFGGKAGTFSEKIIKIAIRKRHTP
jgi:hypothetical protein